MAIFDGNMLIDGGGVEEPTPPASASIDPYYVRDPKTGLSPAQVEAQEALKEAQATNQALGIPSVLVDTPGSAGTISTPPETGLKAGYEWYKFNLPGGGFEWRQKPTKETLAGAYTTLFSGSSSNQTGGGGNVTGSTTQTQTTTYTAPDGKVFTDLNSYNAYVNQLAAEEKRKKGQSAFDILFSEFERYGMGALLNDVREFIIQGLSRDELLLKLRATPAYEKRFAANAQRIKSGLRALSEAEYIGLEDQYQSVMRQYGLPQSYYARGDMGRQEGFEKFIAGDVSPVELEDRIQTAQNRVTNAPKQVRDALSQFYGTELGNGDILAYVLDPERALSQIKRKVTAAEIGAGAAMAGLGTTRTRAEELETFGVTGEQAREKFSTIAEFLPSAQKLGDIYAKQGLGPYNQAVAEQEVFGITGAADAATKRKKLAQLEAAQFSGQVGAAGSALGRERAGQF